MRKVSARIPAIWAEIVRAFRQFFHTNTGHISNWTATTSFDIASKTLTITLSSDALNRHSPSYATFVLRKVRLKSNLAHAGTESTARVNKREFSWNPKSNTVKTDGRSITAPPLLFSPSSIFPSHLFHCAFSPARKIQPVSKILFQFYFMFFLTV
jgi:hypothetical protein